MFTLHYVYLIEIEVVDVAIQNSLVENNNQTIEAILGVD